VDILTKDDGLIPLYIAFSAKYLPALAHAIRTTSLDTQPKALACYIQLLTLLPPPQINPNISKFFASPLSDGLPTLITRALLRGLERYAPGGIVITCVLIMNMLYSCDPATGDDGDAPMDAQTRADLEAYLEAFPASDAHDARDECARNAVEMLDTALKQIKLFSPLFGGPPGTYLRDMRGFGALRTVGWGECAVCFAKERKEDGFELRVCSRC
jgi:hypothetical protein